MIAAVAALLVALISPPEAFAADVPYLTGRLVDNAQILSPAARTRLVDMLKAHEQATANQIVVLTVPTIEPENIESCRGAGVSLAIDSGLFAVAASFGRAPATVARFRAVVEDPTTLVGVAGLDPFQPTIIRKPHEFDQHLAESARRPGRHRSKTKHSIGRYSDLQGKAAR